MDLITRVLLIIVGAVVGGVVGFVFFGARTYFQRDMDHNDEVKKTVADHDKRLIAVEMGQRAMDGMKVRITELEKGQILLQADYKSLREFVMSLGGLLESTIKTTNKTSEDVAVLVALMKEREKKKEATA